MGEKMIVFLFGDNDYFVKMYGISGAQRMRPCLNCKASKAQTEAARGGSTGQHSKADSREHTERS